MDNAERRRQLNLDKYLEAREVLSQAIREHPTIASLLTHQAEYEDYERLCKQKSDYEDAYYKQFTYRKESASEKEEHEQQLLEFEAKIHEADKRQRDSLTLENKLFHHDVEMAVISLLMEERQGRQPAWSLRHLGMRVAGFGPKRPARTSPEKKMAEAARRRLERRIFDIEPFGLFKIETLQSNKADRSDYRISASDLLLEIDRDLFDPAIDRLFDPHRS